MGPRGQLVGRRHPGHLIQEPVAAACGGLEAEEDGLW